MARSDSHIRWNRAWVQARRADAMRRRAEGCGISSDSAVVVYPRVDGGCDEWRGQLPFPAAMRERMQKFLESRV